MIPRRATHVMAFLLIPALFAGCLEIETTTTLHRDGSLRRMVVIKGDSSAIDRGQYTVPLDTTWRREIRKIEDRKLELTASKDFANAEELNNQLRGTPGKTLQSTVSVEESFRWFTSLVTYRERIHRFNPINEIPITDYISQSEIDRFIEHEVMDKPYATAGDSLSLDAASGRYEEWSARNVFAAYFNVFMDGVQRLNDANLTPSFVQTRKDTLFSVFSHIDTKQADAQRRAFEQLLNERAVSEVYRMQEDEFSRLTQQLEFVDEVTSDTYQSSVVMPGLILDTNAPSLEGNRADWKNYMGVAYFQDFEMWITSQVINWWAVVVTSVLVLGGLVVLVLAAIRRRSRSAV